MCTMLYTFIIVAVRAKCNVLNFIELVFLYIQFHVYLEVSLYICLCVVLPMALPRQYLSTFFFVLKKESCETNRTCLVH